MRLSNTAEDYLERLYTREVEGDTARLPETDDRTVGELARHGYVIVSREATTLTAEGRAEAEGAVRRHRLAERLVHDILEVRGQQVDAAACEFEHSLHEGIDEHICILLGHPTTCPHGRPIPAGRCCRDQRGQATAAVTPLSRMKGGEHGTIAYLSSRETEVVQKLMALGVLPGSAITVLQTFPSIVFQVGQTQVAVDSALGSDIFVRRG